MDAQELSATCSQIVTGVETVIVGKHRVVQLALVSALCGGHLLIEDIPGIGKTMLARALARALGCTYKRIQFTPDLLPADVTGTSIFNQKTVEFEFRPGPVFANIVLADEINRATPKTQSSLLECMAEGQVTVDGVAHPLPQPFLVIATENPIEYHGTYPLPEAQLDRFLMRISIGYPRPAEEVSILDRQMKDHPINTLQPVAGVSQVFALQQAVKEVFVEPSLKAYLVEVVTATRSHPLIALGASPRGSLGLLRAAQAWAALAGRDFVLPDDVKEMAPAVLAHRLITKPEARARKLSPEELVAEVLAAVPVPVS